MCQLTFVNTNHSFANKLFTVNQALINSSGEHKDGFGIFSNEKIYKSEKCPWDITNFSESMGKIINDNPVLLHVRKASLVYAQKNINEEHTHPFESEHLILAHNGTLEGEKTLVGVGYAEMIDSQVFLAELEKEYSKNISDLATCLTTTMKLFTGKFAFLIYDKVYKLYYAARGESAALHIFPITIFDKNKEEISSGYIINTELPALISGLTQFSNLLLLNKLRMNSASFSSKEITMLPENSIFLLGDTVEKVGEIKENKRVIWENSRWSGRSFEANEALNWQDWAERNKCKVVTDKSSTRDIYKSLVQYVIRWQVSFQYLDVICWKLLGKSMVCLSDPEFKYILDCLFYLDKYTGKDIMDVWTKIKKIGGWDMDIHYKNNSLEFPYMLNPIQDLRSACDKYEEEYDKSRIISK